MNTIKYKGIEIFEDSDHDTWCHRYCTVSHKLPSGNRIEFSSGWYGVEQFDAKAAVNSVKRQIDEFIQKSTTPEVETNQVVTLRAKFFYYASNPTQWKSGSEEICEYCKKLYQDAKFSNISIQIDVSSNWTEYFEDFTKTQADITARNKRAKVTEARVYGYLIENNEKYVFRVTYKKNSKYVEIEINDEKSECVADKIAQLIKVYEAKEFAIAIKSEV